MSKEAVMAFRQQVSEDAELGQLVRNALAKGEKLDFVALGKSRGFEFTAAEGKEVVESIGEGELTDFELEVIAGGRNMATSTDITAQVSVPGNAYPTSPSRPPPTASNLNTNPLVSAFATTGT